VVIRASPQNTRVDHYCTFLSGLQALRFYPSGRTCYNAAMATTAAPSSALPSWPMPDNVRDRMITQLSARGFILLQTAGRLADEAGLSVYAVGGLVRDLLMGRTSADIDLVVEGDGIAFARVLARELDGTVRAHQAFGTATVALPDEMAIDVATARAETYAQPAALPDVVPGSIMQDLFRRDFTVNAMAIRLNAKRFGELLDPFGGQRDLQARRIRTLHARSFIDDPTRLFRAVRFEARLGFRMDQGTLAQCRKAEREHLPERLSGHRLLNELRLMLVEANPDRQMARLHTARLLRFVHPKLAWTPTQARVFEAVRAAGERYQNIDKTKNVEMWLALFMVLAEGLPARALDDTLTRLAVPAREAEQVRTVHDKASAILRSLARRPPLKPSAIHRLLAGLAGEALCVLMAKASSEAVRKRLLAYLENYRKVTLLVTGTDLKALGLRPGPAYKKILVRLLDARLDGEVRSKADELRLAAKLARV
jgi:tRNA nucleotidyltransferase (CCA-adding enzyme)